MAKVEKKTQKGDRPVNSPSKTDIAEMYGNGPGFHTRGEPGTYKTNIGGSPYFFQTAKQYKDLKRQIAENRRNRRKSAP